MPATSAPRPGTIGLHADAVLLLRAVWRGIDVLIGEHARAGEAAAKAALWRQRRAELRALYLER